MSATLSATMRTATGTVLSPARNPFNPTKPTP